MTDDNHAGWYIILLIEVKHSLIICISAIQKWHLLSLWWEVLFQCMLAIRFVGVDGVGAVFRQLGMMTLIGVVVGLGK